MLGSRPGLRGKGLTTNGARQVSVKNVAHKICQASLFSVGVGQSVFYMRLKLKALKFPSKRIIVKVIV